MIKESLSMSEEKLGQHYLAALNEAFPGVVLDHAWQTKAQLTVTVKVNYQAWSSVGLRFASKLTPTNRNIRP